MKDLYDEISLVEEVEEFKSKIREYVHKLNENRLVEIANEIRRLSEFYENKFSQASTFENMKQSQEKVLNYLRNEIDFRSHTKDNIGVVLVKKILGNFHLFCKSLYKNSVHGKCSDSIKNNLSKLEIMNEYDVQQLMYPLIRSVFPEARLEENEDSGHHTIRKDIVIDSQDIVIELKCSRKSMNERSLSEEIASDIVHYSNKYIFFYIYDKENIIKNPINFKNTYEKKEIEQKEILIEIVQSIEL